MFQDHDADVLRADLGAANTEFFFNLGSEMIQLGHIETEVLRGRPETGKDFETIEGLASPISLHYDESYFFNALERGEPATTGQAFPSATDCRAILCRPGIDNLVIDT